MPRARSLNSVALNPGAQGESQVRNARRLRTDDVRCLRPRRRPAQDLLVGAVFVARVDWRPVTRGISTTDRGLVAVAAAAVAAAAGGEELFGGEDAPAAGASICAALTMAMDVGCVPCCRSGAGACRVSSKAAMSHQTQVLAAIVRLGRCRMQSFETKRKRTRTHVQHRRLPIAIASHIHTDPRE